MNNSSYLKRRWQPRCGSAPTAFAQQQSLKQAVWFVILLIHQRTQNENSRLSNYSPNIFACFLKIQTFGVILEQKLRINTQLRFAIFF
jgi:hypothetical protein